MKILDYIIFWAIGILKMAAMFILLVALLPIEIATGVKFRAEPYLDKVYYWTPKFY